jgi:aminoglycoside phosphotransferase (APT) family kinase protein
VTNSLIEVVSANDARSVAKAGDVFLKVETDPARAEREVRALRSVTTVAVPELLWYRAGPPAVLITSAALGRALTPDDDWRAVGSALASLHAAFAPSAEDLVPANAAVAAHPLHLDAYAEWFRDHGVGDVALVERLTRAAAQFFAAHGAAPVFVHGDFQPDHVFVDGSGVSCIIDWADSGFGDRHQDIAVLTLDHPDRLDEVIAGYGSGLDRQAVWAYWVLRRLGAIRWLNDYGFPIDASLAALPALEEFVR